VFSVLASLAVGAAAVFTTSFWGDSGVVSPVRAAEGTDSEIDGLVVLFEHELADRGYVSQPGTEFLADFEARYCEGDLFSALWANPQSPYIVFLMPEVPGQAPNTNLLGGSSASWRLREDEAIVVIGRTPPPEAYFSVDMTMMKGALRTGPLLWPAVGDPLDNMTVRTTGSTAYERPFAFVITGDRRTRAEVGEMLAAAGLGDATNDLTIPPAMFRLGLDEGSDEFFVALRTAVPDPGFEQALNDYRSAPPLRVLRVRPKGSAADETEPVYPADPLPVPPLRVPGTGTTELDLNPTLQLLRERIIETYPGFEAREVVLERGFEEPYPGLQTTAVTDPPAQGPAGGSYDARYLISPDIGLPDGSFLVVYGTNHVATGKAAYMSVTVYADAEAAVTLATKQHREVQGSARDFIPDDSNVDRFYAWAFSRAGDSGPTGEHVTALPPTNTDYCAPYGTDRPVDMGTAQVLTRAYMEPSTGTRPAISELLLDRVLVFTPQ
jgi:hypothetical protein